MACFARSQCGWPRCGAQSGLLQSAWVQMSQGAWPDSETPRLHEAVHHEQGAG